MAHFAVVLIDLSNTNEPKIGVCDSAHAFCDSIFSNNLNTNEYFCFNNNINTNNIQLVNYNRPQSFFNLDCGFFAEVYLDKILEFINSSENEVNFDNLVGNINNINNEEIVSLKNNILNLRRNQNKNTENINGMYAGTGFLIPICYDIINQYLSYTNSRIKDIRFQRNTPYIANLLDSIKNTETNVISPEITIRKVFKYTTLVKNPNQIACDIKFLIDNSNSLCDKEEKLNQIFIGIANGLMDNKKLTDKTFMNDLLKSLDNNLNIDDKKFLINKINKIKNDKKCNCKNILSFFSSNAERKIIQQTNTNKI